MTQIYGKQYLMTAGPTPLPPAVSQVMAEPILYHRAPAFVEIYARVLERLKMVFQTRNEVLLFAASGSGAMESAVANLLAPGDVALVASCREVRPALGGAVRGARRADRSISRPNGARRSTPPRSSEALADRGGEVKALFTTQSETSTGVLNDVRALAEAATRARRRSASSTRSRASAWSTCRTDDVGRRRGRLRARRRRSCRPPGLAFAAVSERALELAADARERGAHSYYFDWERDPSRASARTRPTARSRRP